MPDDFSQLLGDLVKDSGGTKRSLARAVGITPSAISRLLRGRTVPSTEVCLRIATVTGASASKLLRAAGKGLTADLLEDLYGDAANRRQSFAGAHRVTPNEQRQLALMRALAPKEHRAFCLLLEAAAPRRQSVPIAR